MNTLKIKDLAISERPREKSIEKGMQSLSDAELLAILIGYGNKRYTAMELAHKIVKEYGLARLAKMDVREMQKMLGIGLAKACILAAAFELGRRKLPASRISFTEADVAGQYLQDKLSDLGHEEFWVLLLNQKNELICEYCVSKGGIHEAVIDIRLILKKALEVSAVSMILCHNHPSGSLIPSQQDIKTTQKIKQAAQLMDIKVLDHFIVSVQGYYSFFSNGKM